MPCSPLSPPCLLWIILNLASSITAFNVVYIMVMRRLGSGWRRRTVCFSSSGGGFRFDGIKELMPSPCVFCCFCHLLSALTYTGSRLWFSVIPAVPHKFPLIQIPIPFCSFPTVGLALVLFFLDGFLLVSLVLRFWTGGERPCRLFTTRSILIGRQSDMTTSPVKK